MGNCQSITSPSPAKKQEQPPKEGEKQVGKQEQQFEEAEEAISRGPRNVPSLESENLQLKKRVLRTKPPLAQYESPTKKDKKQQEKNCGRQQVRELVLSEFEEIAMLEKMHSYYARTNTQPYFCSKAARDFPIDLSVHDFVELSKMLRDRYEERAKCCRTQADRKAFSLADKLWGWGDLKACRFSDEADVDVDDDAESEERTFQTVQERMELWLMYGDDLVKNLTSSFLGQTAKQNLSPPMMLPLPSSTASVSPASDFHSMMEAYKPSPGISPQAMLPPIPLSSTDSISIPDAPWFPSLINRYSTDHDADSGYALSSDSRTLELERAAEKLTEELESIVWKGKQKKEGKYKDQLKAFTDKLEANILEEIAMLAKLLAFYQFSGAHPYSSAEATKVFVEYCEIDLSAEDLVIIADKLRRNYWRREKMGDLSLEEQIALNFGAKVFSTQNLRGKSKAQISYGGKRMKGVKIEEGKGQIVEDSMEFSSDYGDESNDCVTYLLTSLTQDIMFAYASDFPSFNSKPVSAALPSEDSAEEQRKNEKESGPGESTSSTKEHDHEDDNQPTEEEDMDF